MLFKLIVFHLLDISNAWCQTLNTAFTEILFYAFGSGNLAKIEIMQTHQSQMKHVICPLSYCLFGHICLFHLIQTTAQFCSTLEFNAGKLMCGCKGKIEQRQLELDHKCS